MRVTRKKAFSGFTAIHSTMFIINHVYFSLRHSDYISDTERFAQSKNLATTIILTN